MRLQLTHGELARFSPAEPGLHAHCVRVRALASEVGLAAGVPLRSALALQQAALLHHAAELVPGAAALDRLMRDIFELPAGAQRLKETPEALAAVLEAYHSFPARTGDAVGDLLAEILALSNLMDEQVEGGAMDETPPGAFWERLEPLQGLFSEKIWSLTRELFPADLTGAQRTWEIPVQPDVAKHLIGLMRQTAPYSLSRMAEIANRDPAIAG